MIPIKTNEDLAGIRKAARILAAVFEDMESFVNPGITTGQIDSRADKLIRGRGGIPAFKGYRGFPASVCASVNEVIVHGIPGKRALEEGDIISLDIGVKFKNYFADAAYTFAVGRVSEEAKKLIRVTEEALCSGIDQVWPGNKLSNVSCAIQDKVESNGYSVVRSFVGHGIGLELHEPPEIPNFAAPGKSIKLKPGMVLALEPMVNMGSPDVKIMSDGWTAATKDGLLSSHVEHTVAVTEKGAEVLTKWQKKNLS